MSESTAINIPSATSPAGTRHVSASSEREAGTPQLVLLLAGSIMAVLGAVLIAPVLPQMTREFASTPGVSVLVPIVLTAPALMIGLTAPFAGLIVDAIDRKRLLLVAMVAYSVFGTMPLYLSSLNSIVGSRVLVGLCEAAIMTCCTTLIGDYWSGTKRSKYLGLQTLVAALAATVFLVVGGVLGASGWRNPFWLYLVAAVIAIPMAKYLWQPARPAVRAAGRRLEPMPWRVMLKPCLVTVFGGIVFYALIVQLAFVLTDAGITSTAVIGGIAAAMSLATAAGAVAFGRLSRFSPHTLLPVEFGLTAVGLLVVFATDSVPMIAAGAVLTGFGTGMVLPTLLTWAVNSLTFSQRGRGTGLFTGTLFIGQFISPLILAGLSVAVGGLQPALGVLGVASAAVALLTLILLRGQRQPLNVTRD